MISAYVAEVYDSNSGTRKGYLRSVSEESNKFSITQNECNAKKYKTLDMLFADADSIARISALNGSMCIIQYKPYIKG